MNLDRIRDYFGLSFESITHRKLRSLLTVIGVFIGIATVVALISIGQGMENAINKQFESFGTDKIIITPGGGEGLPLAGGLTSKPLNGDDEKTVKGVRGVEAAAGMLTKTARVEFKGQSKFTIVNGVPTGETRKLFEETQSYKLQEGRNLEAADRKGVVIGYGVANNLFDKQVRARDKIIIDGEEFRVLGVFEKIGNRFDDNALVITIDSARDLFNEEDEVSEILVKTKKDLKPSDVAEDISHALRKSRDEKKGEESFNVQTYEQVLKSVETILGIVRAVLIGIAGISLLVGAVGIMNTMFTAVLERTREIGVMKAIGARNYDIMSLFMIESGIYGLIGGVIGIAMGLGMSKMAEIIAWRALGSSLLQASFSPVLVIGALAFAFAIGCLSGVMPARMAARLKPVDALRYE